MTEEYEIKENEVEQTFEIKDEATANWYLCKIGNIEAEIARVTAQAESIIQGLRARRENLEAMFQPQLEQWAGEELGRKGGKAKSLKLLQGTVGYRTRPAGWIVADEERVMAEIKARPELAAKALKIEERLLKTAIYEYVEETGEVLAGLERNPPSETFYVRFPKPGQPGGDE